MSRAKVMTVVGFSLWAAVFAAAVGTVYARHEARKLFVELQRLQAERDELDIDWGRLRLEQSTHATHARIETVARDDLAMSVPAPADIVILRAP